MQLNEVLTLQRIKGVGNKSLVALIKFFHANKLESLADLQLFDLSKERSLKRVSSPIKDFFSEGLCEKVLKECDSDLKLWEADSIKVVPFGSESYPKQLSELSDPPAILFCLGNLDLMKSYRSIAVVGTRKNSRIGEVITRKTVEYFCKQGFCIVSGLALGIDALAHRAALESKGKTIAVVVDVVNVSPSQNRPLAAHIIADAGLLVSENPPNTKAIPALFAKRDRIQSGLSMAVFAIETSKDGGTMHAVKAAQDLKRPVYVPDVVAARYPDLNERAISGTQMLAKKGGAKAYSRASYGLITTEIEALALELSSRSDGSGELL